MLPASQKGCEAATQRGYEEKGWKPPEKGCGNRKDTHILLGDRYNMAFTTTIVTYGRGDGIVTATGMDTRSKTDPY